ncbi:YlxM family DNA-binding protein [uncultured Dialister sp.]|uniref:YlxM family DNA-binding protein n=1 Tax=uncultured Dialister sp. TaxID=278064 RepID=UPI0025DA01A8|nr:sigma factor-like helix-turn-helix DNA-binding protein [uncultured Dialister sp.]
MSIENIVWKGELLDCYGALLTERQRDCLDLYYNENLTLAEIAQHFHISRQAVHDAMRHGEEALLAYEAALHLVSFREKKEEAARELMSLIPVEKQGEAETLLQVLSE